jgi:hypothetical protein
MIKTWQQRGADTRYARADFKRDVRALPERAGLERLASLVEEPEWWAETWPLYRVLGVIEGLDQGRVLRVASVPDGKPLGVLTDRQRQALILALVGGV